ncbi:SDR family NAD(P)-dependent oxidoreductase, partial [Acinetobacter baumannii]|uniref:SDR family NAD(P)-dependent oxidoreductase n=1 Tax=Acinetobacter baumannii TaxID=470 RepID=UPI001C089D6F
MTADVGRPDDLRRLEAAVTSRFGGVDILMNNAGIQPGSSLFSPAAGWEHVLAVNLWGVIHGTQIFTPAMIARGRP